MADETVFSHSITAQLRDFESGNLIKKDVTAYLYRVSDISYTDNVPFYTAISPFDLLSLSFAYIDAQAEKNLAETLSSFIAKERILADATQSSKTGSFYFSALKQGVYLLTFEGEKGFVISPVLVRLPYLDETENQWVSDITVFPKYEITPPTPNPPITPPPDPTNPPPITPPVNPPIIDIPDPPTPIAPPELPQTGSFRLRTLSIAILGIFLIAWGGRDFLQSRKKEECP